MKSINNPETITTGTEDLSSGASNRSKTTMGTETDCHLLTNSASTATSTATAPGDKIQINIDYDMQQLGGMAMNPLLALDSQGAAPPSSKRTRREKTEMKQIQRSVIK